MSADIAQDDWDAHWLAYEEASDANPAQTYRRALIERNLGLSRGRDTANVLDFGSGTGALLERLRNRFPGATLRGLEYSTAGVEISARRVPDAETRACDLVALQHTPSGWESWAEIGICSEVLEHLDEPDRFVRNMRRFLKPGARVVVTVPAGPRSAFDVHIGHRLHYTPESFRALLEEVGLDVERVERAGFPFFNLYRLMVIMRGRRLIEDASSGRAGSSRLGQVIAWIFRGLFHANTRRSRWGWQLLAIAREPAQASSVPSSI